LVDINEDATDFVKRDVKELDIRKQAIIPLTRDARELSGEKFDLVELNPPYIPRSRTITDSPYEGVDLLHYVIVNGKKYLKYNGKLILNYSSLSEKITDRSFKEAQKYGGLTSIESIGKKRVPLKVYSILNNTEWINYLKKNHGLEETPERGYDYWHTINIIELMYE